MPVISYSATFCCGYVGVLTALLGFLIKGKSKGANKLSLEVALQSEDMWCR